MNGPSSDRNLLLGIVALQMDFISRDALIDAMHDWTLDKARSLTEILVRSGALDPADRSVLETLVERHIARHGGDPEKSLSSIDLVVPSRSTLESLDDPDIRQSLGKLGSARTRAIEPGDPERTGSWGAMDVDTGERFRIINLHDEGGLGCVFLARDVEVNREVALKQMKEGIAADPQLRARFVFEAEITGNLEHPGIVPVYGKGEYSDGRPYYAMRFIRGETLKSAVDRFHTNPSLKSDAGARRREFQKLLRRFLVVCETMHYAHSRGIIHRDLKPRNIMLGPYGETLVVDWGLAKVVGLRDVSGPSDATLRPPSGSDVQPTTAGARVGTPGYMSPEQARGEIDRLGPVTDIYSLGATLYYMLTKRAPFTDQDVPEVLLKIERGDFPLPREVKSGVDRALEAICAQAMKTRPDERYASCRLLGDDIEHWLADQPVSAYPEPLSRRAMRSVRRHRQWVAAAGLLALLGVTGLALHDVRLGEEQRRTKTALEKLGEEQGRTKQALDVAGREQLRTKLALDQAAEQLQMTRTALRDLLAVAGIKLANIPRAESLRGELAGRVLEYYKKLLAQFPEDSNILFEMARVYRVIGVIDRITGQFTESATAFQKSIEILQKLVEDRARGGEAREWLVQTIFDRGGLYQLSGNTQRAEQDYRSAAARADELMSDADSTAYSRIKGETLLNLSDILALRGKSSEAYAVAAAGVDLLEQAIKGDKKGTTGDRVRWLLAVALTTRGITAQKTPAHKTAEHDFRRATELSEQLPQGSDYFTSGQLQMGLALNELGRVLGEDAANYPTAKQAFDRAIQVLEPLAKESSEYRYYRKALAAALAGRAALYPSHEIFSAQKDCDQAVAILTGILNSEPENPNYLSQQADTLELAGKLASQRGKLDEARKLLDAAISHLDHALRIDVNRATDSEKLTRFKATRKSLPAN